MFFLQRKDAYGLENIAQNSSLLAKRNFITSLAALVTERAMILLQADTNSSKLVLTTALDKIMESVKQDACSWVRQDNVFKAVVLHTLCRFMQLRQTFQTEVPCDELLYRAIARETTEQLLHHSETSSPTIWRRHWQERHLCREVAQELNLQLNFASMTPCDSA